MNEADQALRRRDVSLPALGLVLGPSDLARSLEVPRAEVRRLRYKPGTSVHAAVVVETSGGEPRWLQLTGYHLGDRGKLEKDLRAARTRKRAITALHQGRRWAAVDHLADRHLDGHLLAEHRIGCTLSYNPARRIVATAGAGSEPALVLKVHRSRLHRAPTALLQVLWEAGAPVSRPVPIHGDSMSASEVVPGRPANARDAASVADALARLRRLAPDGAHRRLDRRVLAARVTAALLTTSTLLPTLAPSTNALAATLDDLLRHASHGPFEFVHGDLSPDQVIMAAATDQAVLVDLDDCGAGPRGWDAATWMASQIAQGRSRPVPLPGPAPPATLLAAALAIRSPEPFQRRREGWDTIATRMIGDALALADRAARS